MLTDPMFYLVSIPAVLLYGIAKGGFGGSVAVLAVPLMALVMSPTKAAAILLPILIVMDVLVVRTYWGVFDRRALQLLLPGALVGILAGYFMAGAMNDNYLRILVGVISLVFGLQSLLQLQSRSSTQHHRIAGGLFGALAGFTSFSIHAGGPPFAMYLMPKKLTPVLYAGTAGIFFAAVNAVKIVPYAMLGQFNTENLIVALVLVPLAPLGVWLGHYLVRRSDPTMYYRIISFFLVVVGVKLLHDGLAEIYNIWPITLHLPDVILSM